VQGTRPTLLLFCYQQSKLTIAKNLTFAHIGAAADLALMLWTAGINPAIQLKKTWTLPLGRIGNNFLKKVLKTFWLKCSPQKKKRKKMGVMVSTSRIVEMNTELAFDKQRNVVLPPALRFSTPRTIAGC
jgi:hypothetical protein